MNGCILIFGMPRSGTTWVGKLFDSHPDTLYRHEPDSVRRLSMPLYPEPPATPEQRLQLRDYVAALPRRNELKVVGKLPLFCKRHVSTARFGAARLGVAMARLAASVHVRLPCLACADGACASDMRVVWKSIESPGRLGVCMDALPHARAIHVLRHPCGYVASLLRGEAAGRFSVQAASADQLWVHRLLLATAAGRASGLHMADFRALAPVERLAWRWVLTQEKMLAEASACPRVLTVRYEDLCAAPQAQTRRLFAFAGLDWNAQTEAFVHASTHTTTRAGDTGYYSVYKPPLAAAWRWRDELSAQTIERIEAIVRASSLRRWYAPAIPAPMERSEVGS